MIKSYTFEVVLTGDADSCVSYHAESLEDAISQAMDDTRIVSVGVLLYASEIAS